MNRRNSSPISAHFLANFGTSITAFFLIVVVACSMASHPFTTGTYRYVPKHNFGALYDGGRPHLPRSASTFFASSQTPYRTVNSLFGAVPDYLRHAGSVSPSDLSGVQLFVPETIPADEMPQIGGAELKQNDLPLTDLHGDQKGQLARKNCFFSPLQCSFYYKKRSHHRRSAPGGAIFTPGTVISSNLF
uniref:Secreted protein n=1 Tax=Globodera rostochiensis TaxID=31243 RepID=A0A914HND3_GLORO